MDDYRSCFQRPKNAIRQYAENYSRIDNSSTNWTTRPTVGNANFIFLFAQLNRTNNFVEAWNKKLAGVVGDSHPMIWNVLAAVRMKQSATDGKYPPTLLGSIAPRGRRHTWTRTLPSLSSSTDRTATMVVSLSTFICYN